MDPDNQAERWLGIAAKLLTARDFLGCRTFAIRARESDPNNEVAGQILAVVETVLAGEKRVNASQHPDWYSVLQLPRLVRDSELIANHYRRLVVLLNPERNRFPFADYALQLVMDAWSILSDPNKKWLFDNDLAVYLQRVEQQQAQPVQTPVQTQPVPPVQTQQQVVGNAELNTFQFFQQPVQQQQQVQQQQTVPMSMWEQQQQVQQEHFLNNSQQQQVQQRQHSQIEFMQPQQPPQAAQQQQLPPQWQVRDQGVPRGGVERNKGILNVLGGGGMNTNANANANANTNVPLESTPIPIMRRVAEVAPSVNNMVMPTPIPTQVQVQAQPQPQSQPQAPPVVVQSRTPTATVRATTRVADGNVVVNVGDSPNVAVNNVANSNVINNNHKNNSDTFVASNVVNNHNNNNNDNNNASNDVPGNVGGGKESSDVNVGEEVEKFWTSCPYCYYIYEYPKVYLDCSLRCQNCKRGFHAIKVADPPLDGGEKGERSSFNSWGFIPLGFSTTTWKKNNQMGAANVSTNWVPFSPMFACPPENGDKNFEWFSSNDGAAIGPKNVGKPPASRPKAYVIDDEDGDFVSDPSDSDSSDQDWRRNPNYERKRKKIKRGGASYASVGRTRGTSYGSVGRPRGSYGSVGRPRGSYGSVGVRPGIVRPHNMADQNQLNKGKRTSAPRLGVSTRRAYGSGPYEVVQCLSVVPDGVVPKMRAAKVGARKKVAASITRNQTKRKVKNMGKLDLNVEFNNEGDEQAPTVSTVNGEEDAINNIGFFEGLDEFFSTLPILNVGGEEKPNKPPS